MVHRASVSRRGLSRGIALLTRLILLVLAATLAVLAALVIGVLLLTSALNMWIHA